MYIPDPIAIYSSAPHLPAPVAHRRTQQNWSAIIALTWAFDSYLRTQDHTQYVLTILHCGLAAACPTARRHDEAAFLSYLRIAYCALG